MRERIALLLVAASALALTLGAPGALAQEPTGGPQLPVSDVDPDSARAEAEEILAQPAYQAPDPADRTLLDRLRDWLADRLPDLSAPDGAGGAVDGASTIVVVALVLAAIGLIVWTILRTRRSRRTEEDPDDADIEVEPLRTPTEWEAEARRCEASGDHRGAVRAWFRALTTQLAERDLVADTPGRTAGEQAVDLGDRAPTAEAAFERAATLFEAVWFGGHAATAETAADQRGRVARVLEVAPARARRADAADDDVGVEVRMSPDESEAR